MLRTGEVVTSRLTFAEAASAVARRERNARIDATRAAAILARINADFTGPNAAYLLAEVTPAIVERAAALVRPHGLRGFDAVHLATALLAREAVPDGFSFVTADARLADAARAEGLAVITPA